MNNITIAMLFTLVACTNSNSNEFYDNGVLKVKGKTINNKKEGEWVYFSPDGDTLSKTLYKKGKLNGKNLIFENNKVKEIRNYTADIENGERILFHDNGNILARGLIKEGNQHDKWVVYFENGKIQSTFEFDQGNKIGRELSYYESGETEAEIDHTDSLTIIKAYDSLGKIIWHLRVYDDIIDTLEFNKEFFDKLYPNGIPSDN